MRNVPLRKQGCSEVAKKKRHGAVVPLLAVCLVPLLGMMAFSIDYGYLRVVKSELQRSADAACLAAVIELVPNPDGIQDLDAVRATVREYVQNNMTNAAGGLASFSVLDADIEMGRYDENTIYDAGPVLLHQTGQFDALRITSRRDGNANGPVPLFFAQVLGLTDQEVVATATAVLRRGNTFKGGADILPFALPEGFWDSLSDGDELSIYNDNTITDEYGNAVTMTDELGLPIPGNWGTVDVGFNSNSSSDLKFQILNGIIQGDSDALHNDGRLPDNQELRAPVLLQADTGSPSVLRIRCEPSMVKRESFRFTIPSTAISTMARERVTMPSSIP